MAPLPISLLGVLVLVCGLLPVPVPASPLVDGSLGYQTVFHTGELGFGCMRFPNMAVVEDRLFMFVECYNASGDHCQLVPGQHVPNCHAYGMVCYKESPDNGLTWGGLQTVPSRSEWARGHSSLYDPERKRLCVHYNGGFGTKDTQWVGWRYAQCLDVATNVWGAPANITAQLAPACQPLLGSRQTTVRLASGRQLFSQWRFPSKPTNHVCIYATDDGGSTFRTLLSLERSSELGLVQLANGSVYFNARQGSHQTRRVVGYSSDNGETWDVTFNSTHSPIGTTTDLTPGPLLDVPTSNGGHALILSLPRGPGRLNMTVYKSLDGGATWPAQALISTDYGGYSGLCRIPGAPSIFGLAYESSPVPGSKCTGACSVRFSRVPLGF